MDDANKRIGAGLPDANYIRAIIRRRQRRTQLFGENLFADPAWDILLDLALARVEHKQVSITSLCIAVAVPTSTALRWITQMVSIGLLLRIPDPFDRRRSYIALADHTADAMAQYFIESGADADIMSFQSLTKLLAMCPLLKGDEGKVA